MFHVVGKIFKSCWLLKLNISGVHKLAGEGRGFRVLPWIIMLPHSRKFSAEWMNIHSKFPAECPLMLNAYRNYLLQLMEGFRIWVFFRIYPVIRCWEIPQRNYVGFSSEVQSWLPHRHYPVELHNIFDVISSCKNLQCHYVSQRMLKISFILREKLLWFLSSEKVFKLIFIL